MCSTILILLLSILQLTSGGFTGPSVLDLKCLNDYETEMKCNLTLAELAVCSEYNLNVSIERIKDGLYACTFEESRSSTCQCTLKAWFIAGEIFKIDVLRGGKILHTKEISIVDTIKPKQPIIASVQRTELGNFLITLNIKYSKDVVKSFIDSLVPELSYGIEGSTDYEKKQLGRGYTKYEIIGSNLKPDSKYVLRVRVKSDYSDNSNYSDYSEPYHFTTSSPSQNVLIIISSILCVILIICISSIYYWYNKILKVWWLKIPTPKIATNFVKQVEQMLLFQNELSPICIEPSNLDHRTAVSLIMHSHLEPQECGTLPGKAPCTQTKYECVHEAQCELPKEHSSGCKAETSASDYGNLQANSGSSFNNKLYLNSSSNCTCLNQTSGFNLMENVLLKALDPIIPTDFDYGTCNAFVSTSPVLFSEMVVVPEYQCIGEIMDHGCKDSIIEKQNCSKNQEVLSLSVLRPSLSSETG